MEYIFPNPNEKICIVKYTETVENIRNSEMLPKEDILYKKIMQQLELPFHQSVIKLNQCSRNLMKDSFGPNILLLSNNEGGFAEHGISVTDGNHCSHYPELNYVDLVIDEEILENGELQIFSHELGHVMMSNILSNFPHGNSTKQHVSMGITDFFMAFNEGWAIHFERLAYDSVDLYKKIMDTNYDYKKDIKRLWLCNSDTELRLNGVLNNIYIYKKLISPIDKLNVDIISSIILEHTSTMFDKTSLKNAQEMLSSEGLMATIFHRIDTNETLQNNYLSEDFYNNFLVCNITSYTDAKKLFTPLENVILKTFWVFYKMKDTINENSIPPIEFIEAWCNCFPKDAPEIIKLFITTTVGKTLGNELSDIYEKMSHDGMLGHVEAFVEDINEYQHKLTCTCEKILNGDIELSKNVGSELWIENTHVKIPSCLWSQEELLPLNINLNTASIYDLMSFPKIDLQKAIEIIEQRNQKGYFDSIEEVGKEYFL